MFGGLKSYKDHRHQKVTHCQIYAAAPTVPFYLKWSERLITFDKDDNLDHVIKVGQFPLVVSVVVEGVRMTWVLMDGGSSIIILYKDAFKKLNIRAGNLCPSHFLFHGIVPGCQVMPLGTITLSVKFSD